MRHSITKIPNACSLAWGLTVAAVLLSTGMVSAQQDWEKDGGIPNAEIEIIKDRQITLPPADRTFEKIPPRPAEPIKPEIQYQFRNLSYNSPDFSPSIRPMKLKQEDLTRIFGNYLSGGVGNYSSIYLDAAINTKRDKNRYLGMRGYHRSFGTGSVDGKNSASGTTELKIFGKAMSNTIAMSGSANYENRSMYYYGYTPGSNPSRDAIRQNYNLMSLQGGIESATSSDIDYSLKAGYNYVANYQRAHEGEISLLFNGVYGSSENSRFMINSDYYLIDYKTSSETPTLPDGSPLHTKVRHLFRVKPAYQFTAMEHLLVTAGANIAYENDDVGKNKSLHVYPNVRADYQAGESVTAYASLSGDMDKVSFHTLTRENSWINSDVPLYHTNRSIELMAGLKGNVSRKVSFGAGFSVANLKNLYFYRNDSVVRSHFDVVYDLGNVKRFNPFAELGYNYGENVKMALRGDYYSYATDQVAEAYHRPAYRVGFYSTYSLYSKLLFNVDFIAQGGAKAYDYELSKTLTLKTAVDLNARVDYFVSRQVSAFLKFENILSNSYQVYLYYPVRGFQALGGVTWSF